MSDPTSTPAETMSTADPGTSRPPVGGDGMTGGRETPQNRPRTSSTRSDSIRGRILSAAVAMGCLAWLVIGASLTPDPSGMGTHRQLGLPPCGWLASLGRPCPTCGMTTAFSHTARGHLLTGFLTQPFAAALAIGVSTAFWASLHAAVTGSVVARVYAFLLSPRWVWVMLGFLAASWAYVLATWPGARE